MKILVIDNYDSFTYNLVHYLNEVSGEKVSVARNDEITVDEVAQYEKILLSPGPGIPDEAGILKEVIEKLSPARSIIGICLGMQAIAEVYGGKLVNLKETYHGIATAIDVTDPTDPLFRGLPQSFKAGRYHSWVADRESLPHSLRITATDRSGLVMGLRHIEYDVCGLQFHPESILTENGKKIISNWLGTINTISERPLLPAADSEHFNGPEAFSNSLCC